MQYKLYQFFRPLATCLIRLLYRVEYINIENIPQNGPFILAGNHKSNFDCVLLMSSCSKTINFLAKRELIDGKLGFFFKRMGIIPVEIVYDVLSIELFIWYMYFKASEFLPFSTSLYRMLIWFMMSCLNTLRLWVELIISSFCRASI